jgi:hypothetical protein
MWLTSVAGWVGWQALQALRRAGISAGGRWGWGAAEAIRGAVHHPRSEPLKHNQARRARARARDASDAGRDVYSIACRDPS